MKRIAGRERMLILFILALSAFSGGCATTGEGLLSRHREAADIAPSIREVEANLAGRAYEVGSVTMDIRREHPPEDHPLTDEAYIKLMRNQLEKAFASGIGMMSRGMRPPCRVDVAIEERRFTAGRFFIPKPSILSVRLSVYGPEGTLVMRGAMESRDLETVPVILGGIPSLVSLPMGEAAMAHSRLIPAMAALVTKLVQGLQEGKTLDAIEVYSDDFPVPPANYVLNHQDYGMSLLTVEETESITGIDLDGK